MKRAEAKAPTTIGRMKVLPRDFVIMFYAGSLSARHGSRQVCADAHQPSNALPPGFQLRELMRSFDSVCVGIGSGSMGEELSLEWRGATIRYRRFGQGPVLLYLRSEDSLPDSP